MVEEIAGADNLRTLMNEFGKKREPFLFLIDYHMERGVVIPVSDIPDSGLACRIGGKNYGTVAPEKAVPRTELNIKPVPKAQYAAAFNNVADKIKRGDSYLVNLTFKTPIGRRINMAHIFRNATSPYRFLWPGRFVFFSPESFVKIEHGIIRSYPMKGTIDAACPEAEKQLLADYKERCEHNTIVDLIRNDISAIADNVKIERFRYIEKIKTHKGELLQSSSEISGQLSDGWQDKIGDYLFSMLPAGSISGAPKRRTVEIIAESETTPRGYYTGIMGIFECDRLESCVAIRYIEKCENGEYYYRSGGGITSCSRLEDEYEEMISKIYVPVI